MKNWFSHSKWGSDVGHQACHHRSIEGCVLSWCIVMVEGDILFVEELPGRDRLTTVGCGLDASI